MKQQSHQLFVARCAWGILALGVLLYCAWQYFGVSGKLTVTQDFSQPRSRFLSLFIPQDRASDVLYNTRTGSSVQVLSETPVYMTVETPRAFDSVTATVKYKTEHRGRIDFGVVELLNPLSIKKSVMDFPLIQEAIDAHWKQSVDSTTGQVVYSKDGRDLTTVKQQVSEGVSVALADTTLPVLYREKNPLGPQKRTIPVPLRGSHDFVVYISNGMLQFDATLVDTNLSGGVDPATVIVVNEAQEEVFKKEFADDGNSTNNRVAGPAVPVSAEKTNLPEGVYHIVVQTSSDMVIKDIQARVDRLVIKDRVTLAGVPRIPGSGVSAPVATTVFAQTSGLSAVTDSAESLQTLTTAGRSLTLSAAGEVAELEDLPTDVLALVAIPVADVRLSFSGYLSFSEDAYMNPDFQMKPIRSNITLSDIEAIVTNSSYVSPIVTYLGKEATLKLPLDYVLGDRKKLQFTLEAADLKSDKDTLEVQSVRFEFHRQSLIQRLRQRFAQ